MGVMLNCCVAEPFSSSSSAEHPAMSHPAVRAKMHFANLMSIYNFFMMNVIFCSLYNTCSK
ncbi:Uncharacterised protein [Segatella copri]|nr:Uncharacterised protein [Segatella copri]